ncbi:hypothetical protein O7623_21645 [Solwaraspora sp. WMMD791]|uniref:hypothetical protein n=1 Tax=Solwaraspora sp. WMMD791 TaxID=3016086 RepID=UPI00249A4116|nr:hypothetical protein [Solwaraspora sp. WMMD791]WFE25949.1 hypothetical protein O7623_21645 [Solwaraspora sp. WMMD791]
MVPEPASAPAAAAPRRPAVVVAAVLLAIPTAVLWLVAGVAILRVGFGAEGLAAFLMWIIAAGIFGICLLLLLMTLGGMRVVWTGGPNMLQLPAGVTVGLVLVVPGVLLLLGRIDYNRTMVAPMIVGGLAGLALILLETPPARRWVGHRP